MRHAIVLVLALLVAPPAALAAPECTAAGLYCTYQTDDDHAGCQEGDGWQACGRHLYRDNGSYVGLPGGRLYTGTYEHEHALNVTGEQGCDAYAWGYRDHDWGHYVDYVGTAARLYAAAYDYRDTDGESQARCDGREHEVQRIDQGKGVVLVGRAPIAMVSADVRVGTNQHWLHASDGQATHDDARCDDQASADVTVAGAPPVGGQRLGFLRGSPCAE